MTSELERTKAALEIALKGLQSWYESGDTRDITRPRIKEIIREINTILNPVEYEEIEEIVGWVNVYQRENGSCFAGSICHSEESANKQWAPNGCALLSCQPIRVTVKREKKRPVERSYVIQSASFRRESMPGTSQHVLCPWRDDLPVGVKGTLTFTYTEDPTT